jgi:hypothetical protein
VLDAWLYFRGSAPSHLELRVLKQSLICYGIFLFNQLTKNTTDYGRLLGTL